jgi:hypothetical protein
MLYLMLLTTTKKEPAAHGAMLVMSAHVDMMERIGVKNVRALAMTAHGDMIERMMVKRVRTLGPITRILLIGIPGGTEITTA